MTTAFLIILFRWKITLLKQRGLCELCEIPETLWIVYLKVFIYLIEENTGAVHTNCQGAEIQRNKRYHTYKGKKFPLTLFMMLSNSIQN